MAKNKKKFVDDSRNGADTVLYRANVVFFAKGELWEKGNAVPADIAAKYPMFVDVIQKENPPTREVDDGDA